MLKIKNLPITKSLVLKILPISLWLLITVIRISSGTGTPFDPPPPPIGGT